MEINDKVFGKMDFDYTWSRVDNIIFAGKSVEVIILVSGDEEGEFEKGQYKAYETFINKWDSIQDSILESILEYYINKREELGYDIEPDECYPEIKTKKELLNHITLVGIKIPYADIYGGRSVGLSFDCTWNTEDGLGVRLNDEQVIEVGYQDIAI